MTALHPRAALFDPGEPAATLLPVCDHYCGVEARMRKSLELQAELGPVFDVTLDAEDGAPIGGEVEHALLIASLLASEGNRFGRVGARVLPIDHPRFNEVVEIILQSAKAPAYLMLPKPRGVAEGSPSCSTCCMCCTTSGWPGWRSVEATRTKPTPGYAGICTSF